MSLHFLKLNLSKTELILFPSAHAPSPDFSIKINNATISPFPHLSFQPQIQSLSKSCRLHLRNISKIRPFLTSETTKQLIHSLVISRLDYCNSLLIGRPHHRLSPLQSIMNAAARLIHLTNRFVFAIPLCQSLH
ncbi:unnamed protein product [Staurois parvus]|uniref:Uncharacterized protein n=1 Tax=Staurois parvus TaxID=386267 RepID=A0ABN9APF2_9NEOB|nr:unnamed protein product [Staurois parvus]